MKKRSVITVILLSIAAFATYWSCSYNFGTREMVEMYVLRPVDAKISDVNEPGGGLKWFISPPESYEHFFIRNKEVVAQWIQYIPSYGQKFTGVPSPHTYDEWVEKGKKIPYLEDTLIQFHDSNNKFPGTHYLLIALCHIGTEKSVYILSEILEDKTNPNQYRLNAASAIGDRGDLSSAELLRTIALDKSEDTFLRSIVAGSLAKIEGKKCKKLIEKLLTEDVFDEHDKKRLLRALEQLK